MFPWTSADAKDPTWPYKSSNPAELYNLDGVAYESLTIGFFSLFRGFVNGQAESTGARTSAEHDEIYLGFSRDGFHWYRQFDGGDMQTGGANPRRPFMDQSWPVHTFRNSGVQSAGGGLVLGKVRGEERLLFYASAQSGMPFDPHWTGGNSTMGLASLRRDGFTSVEAMLSGQPGSLATRPIVWDAAKPFLFLNAVVQTGGFLQVSVLDPGTNRTLAGFEAARSTVGSLSPAIAGGCVPDGSPAFDSTRAAVSWPGASLASVAGRPLRLRFTMVAASLYSFWVSGSACGASGGVVGAGGPGLRRGRDMHGSCERI